MRMRLSSLVPFAFATSLLGCPGRTDSPDAFVLPDTFAPPDAGTDALGDAFEGPDAPSPDARSVVDAFLGVDATAPTMNSYSYVVSTIVADSVVDGAVSGIDIDDFDSGSGVAGSCARTRPDYRSSIRGVGGIDNQLSAQLLATLVAASVDINRNLVSAIAQGELLLLVTVDDVDDFVEDADGVLITVSGGEVLGGGAPRLDGRGRLMPGQTFRRVMAGTPMAGELRGNRISVAAGSLPLPLVLGDPTSTVPLMNAQITARIAADRLFEGEAGGGGPVDAIIAFAEMRGFGAIARSLLARNADLDPDPAMMTNCRQISVGFRIDAVSAVVE